IDEDALAVTGGGRGRQRAFVVGLLRESAAMHRRLPQELSRLPIEAVDGLDLTLVVGRGQEHPVANDRRRTMTATGNGHFPEDIVCRTPFQRRLLLRRGNAVAMGAAPPGPVAL